MKTMLMTNLIFQEIQALLQAADKARIKQSSASRISK